MSQVNHLRISAELQGSEKFKELAAVLELVFTVKFESPLGEGGQCLGEIIATKPGLSAADENGANGCRLIVPPSANESYSDQATEIRVRFADDANVPFPFQGRSLNCKVGVRPQPLKLVAGEKALLTCESGVLWAQSEARGAKVFRSALVLPGIPTKGNLHDVLNGDRFLELLPLLHFLRTVTGYDQWQRPPLRAQFMFDDPNLHWPTYGLVKYSEIATRAERENYHVSFATVPLDAWFTHGGAAEIFRKHPARLSLCVHGNDHTKKELAQSYSQPARAFLLQQAIRRIAQLEQRTNLRVARVMVPPHGACSHEMLTEIGGSGFEAACISHGSLRAHNRARSWTRTLGYLPSEQIEGCPVLPRWGFVGTTESTILLAAFLDQPIVLRGHHQDLKDGIELLDGFARIINGLGKVCWANMTEISRLNYFWRMQTGVMGVRPLTKKIEVQIPEAATELFVERLAPPERVVWKITASDGTSFETREGERLALPTLAGKTVSVETLNQPTPVVSDANRLPVTAFVRRLLTEGRDRFQGVWRSN